MRQIDEQALERLIEEVTRQLIEEAAPGNRVIVGITEDIPANRWQESMLAIARTIDECGIAPISR